MHQHRPWLFVLSASPTAHAFRVLEENHWFSIEVRGIMAASGTEMYVSLKNVSNSVYH